MMLSFFYSNSSLFIDNQVPAASLEEENDDRVPKTEYLPVNFLQFIDIDEMCVGKCEEVALILLRSDI